MMNRIASKSHDAGAAKGSCGREYTSPCQIARRYENASRNRPQAGQNNNTLHTGRVPWEREEFMVKIRRREVYKSRTKSINNIYLGGPKGPTEEDLEALKSLASRSDEGGVVTRYS